MLPVFNVSQYPCTENPPKYKFEKSPVTSVTGIHEIHITSCFPVTTSVFFSVWLMFSFSTLYKRHTCRYDCFNWCGCMIFSHFFISSVTVHWKWKNEKHENVKDRLKHLRCGFLIYIEWKNWKKIFLKKIEKNKNAKKVWLVWLVVLLFLYFIFYQCK